MSRRTVRFSKGLVVNLGDYNTVRFEAELQEELEPGEDRSQVLAELRDEVELFLDAQVRRLKKRKT